ncbi:hypothetical protein PHISP_08735, partial [Aspergillus sp. HF37]
PVPGQSGQHLSHDQDPGCAVLLLLQQERRPEDHRPASGHRLGHADGRNADGRAIDQPVRLRWRLWHGAEPVPDAGGHRLSDD